MNNKKIIRLVVVLLVVAFGVGGSSKSYRCLTGGG